MVMKKILKECFYAFDCGFFCAGWGGEVYVFLTMCECVCISIIYKIQNAT